jgi:hypothetical protein
MVSVFSLTALLLQSSYSVGMTADENNPTDESIQKSAKNQQAGIEEEDKGSLQSLRRTSKISSKSSQKNTPSVKDEDQKKDIYLNFENTSLLNVVNYMAELKKINLLPDKTLEGAKISLTIRDPLNVDGAWNIFLTILEMSGFSIV